MQRVSAFVGPGQSQKCPLNEETFRGKCANEPVFLRILPFVTGPNILLKTKQETQTNKNRQCWYHEWTTQLFQEPRGRLDDRGPRFPSQVFLDLSDVSQNTFPLVLICP